MTGRGNAAANSLTRARLEASVLLLRNAARSIDRLRAGTGCADYAGFETHAALVGSSVSDTHAFSLAEGAAHLPIMGRAAAGVQIALRGARPSLLGTDLRLLLVAVIAVNSELLLLLLVLVKSLPKIIIILL